MQEDPIDKVRKRWGIRLLGGMWQHQPLDLWERVLLFIEQPLFLAVVGLIGSVVGVLLAVPLLVICDGCLLLALHRSQAIADKSPKIQLAMYSTLAVVAGALFIWVGTIVQHSAHAFAQEIAGIVITYLKTEPKAPIEPNPAGPHPSTLRTPSINAQSSKTAKKEKIGSLLSSSLAIDVKLLNDRFNPESNVFGITWKEEYYPVSLTISNNAAFGIDHVELRIMTDGFIARIEQTANLPDIDNSTKRTTTTIIGVGHGEASVPQVGKWAISKEAKLYIGHLKSNENAPFLMAATDVNVFGNPAAYSTSPESVYITGFFETGPVEGAQRIPVKWQRRFKDAPQYDSKIRQDIEQRIEEYIGDGERLKDRMPTRYEILRWINVVGTYLDHYTTHSCTVAFNSIFAGPSVGDQIGDMQNLITSKILFLRHCVEQSRKNRLLAWCDVEAWR